MPSLQFLVGILIIGQVAAFVGPTAFIASSGSAATALVPTAIAPMLLDPTTAIATAASSSVFLSASTIDPATFLANLLAGLIGSDAILLVPIFVALSVAGVVAFFIISYATPEVEDDDGQY